MAKTTVRILRMLPLFGVVYRANDLVVFDQPALELLDEKSFDASEAAVKYCKKEGVKPVALGVDPRVKKEKPTKKAVVGDDGELVE